MIKGFKMKLFPGMEAEYKRRHDELWDEVKDMIHEYGGKNYSIFLDRETNTLFWYIEIESEEKWVKSADTEICRKWWDYMADIMDTNPDNSPVSIDLKNVFHLDWVTDLLKRQATNQAFCSFPLKFPNNQKFNSLKNKTHHFGVFSCDVSRMFFEEKMKTEKGLWHFVS